MLNLLVFFLGLSLDLFIDYIKWKRNLTITHHKLIKWSIRVIAILVPSIMIQGSSHVALGLLLCSVYYLLFDGLFNVVRKMNWWFTGGQLPGDENKASLSDKFLKSLGKYAPYVKILLIVLFSLVYFLNF